MITPDNLGNNFAIHDLGQSLVLFITCLIVGPLPLVPSFGIYSSNGALLPDLEHPFAVHSVLIPDRTKVVKLKINPKLHGSFRVWVWRNSH